MKLKDKIDTAAACRAKARSLRALTSQVLSPEYRSRMHKLADEWDAKGADHDMAQAKKEEITLEESARRAS